MLPNNTERELRDIRRALEEQNRIITKLTRVLMENTNQDQPPLMEVKTSLEFFNPPVESSARIIHSNDNKVYIQVDVEDGSRFANLIDPTDKIVLLVEGKEN